MRLFIALLLVAVALPCYAGVYYVNAGDPRARDLPAAQGYGTADSPWITPSYAVAQMSGSTAAAHDTLYIYAYALTDTNDGYVDNITTFDEYIDYIGVSVNGDSPTFTKSGLFLYGRYVNTGGRPSACVIRGFRFTKISNSNPNAIINQSNGSTTSWHHDYVEDCIFHNNYGETFANSAGVVAFTIDRLASSATADSNILTIRNCAFVSNGTPSILANHYNGVNPNFGYITVDNCSFRNDSIALSVYKYGGNDADTSFYVTNSIFADCDTFLRYFRENSAYDLAQVSVAYTDTSNIKNNHQIINAGTGGIYVHYSNHYTDKPLFYTAKTDTLAAFAYLQITGQPTNITTGSSTGGLLGVLWGGTFTPYIAPMVGGAPPATRFMQFLLRGRYR